MKTTILKTWRLAGVVMIAALLCVAEAGAADSASLPVKIRARDPMIRFIGRFTEQGNPQCAWPGSTIQVKFMGTALNMLMKDGAKGGENKNGGRNNNYLTVVIDNAEPVMLGLETDQTVYRIADNLAAGEHTALIFRRCESHCGIIEFMGFELAEGGKLVELPPRSQRRIEFIGDSITCGYGNEAPTKENHFCPLTENNYYAYGAVASRKLGAEYVCLAWSGIGAYTSRGDLKNVMGARYNKILPWGSEETWDFKKWTPHVVFINLGTNDFYKDKEDPGDNFIKAYREFLKTVRGNYPEAQIFCGVGPMLWGGSRTKCIEYIKSILTELNDPKMSFVDLGTQNGEKNGIGADWHPSLKTHALLAEIVTKTIEEKMGWTRVDSAGK